MRFTNRTKVFMGVILMMLPSLSVAHHSTAGFFDSSTKIEIAGVVTRILWRNPHTVFEIDVENEGGGVTRWSVESGALSVLRAQGLTDEVVGVGDFVKVLGDKSLRNRPETFARNMLVASGEEVFLTLGARAHFSSAPDVDLMAGNYDEDLIAEARDSADGIFRVWSRIEDDLTFTRPIFNAGAITQFPYTEIGRAIRDEWDPSAEFILGCTEWNMPRLMGNPLPMEFVHEDEKILIKFEESDSRRTVYMGMDLESAPEEHSLLGYSVGHWEEDTLVIQTNSILANSYELPVSDQIQILEKLSASADGTRLDYEIVVTDPVMLASPVTLNTFWSWRPEIVINSYACEQEQQI